MSRSAGLRKTCAVALDDEMVAQLKQFMHDEEFASQSAAMRELLRRSFASTPEDAAIRSARRQAYDEVRRWVLSSTASMMKEIQRQLDEAMVNDTGIVRMQPSNRWTQVD